MNLCKISESSMGRAVVHLASSNGKNIQGEDILNRTANLSHKSVLQYHHAGTQQSFMSFI